MRKYVRYGILIMSFTMFQIVLPMLALGGTNVLYTFDTCVEKWRSYQGPKQVTRCEAPSFDSDGSLQVNVSLMGTGWSDNTFESPEMNMDMSHYREIRIQVFIPSGAPSNLMGQIFVKSGPNWTWRDNGWHSLQQEQWTLLSIPTTRLEHINNIRAIGIKIGSNSRYSGLAYIDRIEALPTQVIHVRPSLKISEIIENSHIAGRVFGLDPTQYDQHKVVVYVKTDKWYIHPYEKGGEGLSFAEINKDGSWEIETVKRRFLADLVAVFLVNKSYSPPSIIDDIRQIDFIASYTEEARGKL